MDFKLIRSAFLLAGDYLQKGTGNCLQCYASSADSSGFCCSDCADQAFADDLKSYLRDDLNDAKCIGTKSSPVGSPRQRAFCGRMCGHKKKNTGADAKSDPDSCINQALRRWKCRCS